MTWIASQPYARLLDSGFMRLLALLFLLTLFAGCGSAEKEDTAPVADPQAQPSPAPLSDEPKVKQYKDKRTAGWAFKDDDQAFEIERTSGCLIKWNVATYHARPKELEIQVKDTCRFDGGLNRSLPYYGQILDAVVAKYSKSRLKVFRSSSWRVIKAWDQDMAVAAIESGLWKTFLKKREERKKDLNPNKVFVEVFNQGNVARKLSQVFETHGLTLKLKSVEKVFEKPFKKLPFSHEYAAYSASNTKVPYAAGTYIFEIKPLDP
jgi:hypothetical protein